MSPFFSRSRRAAPSAPTPTSPPTPCRPDPRAGKSKGFCFIAYEDQRSTVLAVDNLSGAKVAGRIIRVEHVLDYKLKRKEAGQGPSFPTFAAQKPPERSPSPAVGPPPAR